MVNPKRRNTLDSLKRDSITEKVLCNTETEINTTDSGLLAKNRDQACMNGQMETTMTEHGKKTQPRELALHASEESFMMDSFILDRSMASDSRQTLMVTQ